MVQHRMVLEADDGAELLFVIYRIGELRLASDVSIRRAHQRLAQMADFRRSEPLTSFSGEVPTLLQEAMDLAERQGLDHAAIAGELCWSSSHLAELLGQPDKRPRLYMVR